VQYLAGELRVRAGEVLPLLAQHNTVRLRFDVEAAEYLHLAKPDAAFPAAHFSMLADARRNQARTHASPAVHVMHTGCPRGGLF
jgi:protein arginine N-methyltransferase 7